MKSFITVCEPPAKRRDHCTGGKEHKFNEAAPMIAFAMHMLDGGATDVEIHPDGEHGKRYDIRTCFESLGFTLTNALGTTKYGGVYRRDQQTGTVSLKPGLGDVVASIGEQISVAECKGGIINTKHPGQLSKLRGGLYEAVGSLMSRSIAGEKHIAVLPETNLTRKLAEKIARRAFAAGIEIALVDEQGKVTITAPSAGACVPTVCEGFDE